MSTRAEQVEACFKYARQRVYSPLFDTHAIGVRLTRDGELRERLKKLVEEWRHRAPYNEQCYANRLSELLKETSDEHA